jgi:hypothetical protein
MDRIRQEHIYICLVVICLHLLDKRSVPGRAQEALTCTQLFAGGMHCQRMLTIFVLVPLACYQV